MIKEGDIALHFEDYWVSGEQGCVRVWKVTGFRPADGMHTIQWLGHTCDNPRPAKTCSAKLHWMMEKGQIIWVSGDGKHPLAP